MIGERFQPSLQNPLGDGVKGNGLFKSQNILIKEEYVKGALKEHFKILKKEFLP